MRPILAHAPDAAGIIARVPSDYVEMVRHGYAEFAAGRPILQDETTPDFVWDMSNFTGWTEQSTYEGVDGALAFLAEWSGAWDAWRLEVGALHDAGDKVVAVIRQHGT